jgi:excisionase family DNA binding protein
MTATELAADGTIGVKEAQAFTGLGRTSLYELMDRGVLPYTRVGDRRLIPKRALVELLAAGMVGSRGEETPHETRVPAPRRGPAGRKRR